MIPFYCAFMIFSVSLALTMNWSQLACSVALTPCIKSVHYRLRACRTDRGTPEVQAEGAQYGLRVYTTG